MLCYVMNSVLIHPGLPEEMIYRSIDDVVNHISSNKDFIEEVTVTSNEDIVQLLKFPQALEKHSGTIGDTLKIFKTSNKVYFMTFLDDVSSILEFNVLGSLFHTKCSKIYGAVLITCYATSDHQVIPINFSDVLYLLHRRVFHTGYRKDAETKKIIEIDNRWNIIKGVSDPINISSYPKRMVLENDDYFIRVDSPNESEVHYLFQLLDDKEMILIDAVEA
jgi:hypothetical protein